MVANTKIDAIREALSDDTLREMLATMSVLREAHEHMKTAIAELKTAGQPIPISLHYAARNMSYVLKDEGNLQALRDVLPPN
jgi:hypothetical protein